MTQFLNLPSHQISMEEGTAFPRFTAADAQFRVLTSESPLRMWSPGEPIPATGLRLLIGIATWSVADMRLLDAVAASLASKMTHLTVEVFNAADCASATDFARYVPEIADVYHTPVVGLWRDGELIEKGSGKTGRELVVRVCGLDMDT